MNSRLRETRAGHWSWMAAAVTVLLWLPQLMRSRVHPFLELAYLRGAIAIPAVGIVLAVVSISRRPNRMAMGALGMNIAMLGAYFVLSPLSTR